MEKTFRFWGPAFLLANFALFPEPEFFAVGLIGFCLSTFWSLRGAALSLIPLCGFAVLHHEPMQMCLAASLAITFMILGLVAEREVLTHQSLLAQMDARTATLTHLEEELEKAHQYNVKAQLTLTEKNTQLQKELEDLQADHSSILILNEVLRQNTARHMKEEEEQKIRIEDLTKEVQMLQNELDRPLASQNADLMKELNAARVKLEQTQLINETIARLHARQVLKANETEQENGSLKDLLRAQRPQNNPHLVDELAYAKEKLEALLQIEPKFRQLRDQFEERNEILHLTRSQLFKADTELQKLKMEKEEAELNAVPMEFAFQIERLEEENQQLQELVTLLSESPSNEKKK
jgi:hypothetical protein